MTHRAPTAPDPVVLAARLAGLAARLRATSPSLGPVRLVAVDGHAGSGKSTLATALAAALGGAPVIRLDDLARHGELFAWTDRLTTHVLAPLARGEVARYPVYDWERRAVAHTACCPPAPVVLLEGVGAGRRALRPHLSRLIWVDVPAAEAWERGRLRDGPRQAAFWQVWERAERRHLADDPSRPFADILMRPRGDRYDMDEAGPIDDHSESDDACV
ncbi:uridine kinase family protein [Streptomyces sp. 4N509B]|uniref:uridine kinase family protein n=1 Tax=Streptomyces sp. 4N509B TaxID=3457413 RepID=UPI003FCF558D